VGWLGLLLKLWSSDALLITFPAFVVLRSKATATQVRDDEYYLKGAPASSRAVLISAENSLKAAFFGCFYF
jgi:hypothetical protein